VAGLREHRGAARAVRTLSDGARATVAVRPFRASDQAAARALIEEGLGEHFGFVDRDVNLDLVDIGASFAAPHAFFVAHANDELIGTTGLIVAANRGQLVRVAVARNHRRLGVASALLNYVTGLAPQLRLSELVVHTQPEWLDAMSFYLSHGFTQYGRDAIDVYLRREV
jgi:GNAT superfamily N-acetyltransferase